MADDDDGETVTEELSGRIRGVESQTRGLTGSANAFARAITSAFAQGATGAKSFDSTLKSLGMRLSTLVAEPGAQAAHQRARERDRATVQRDSAARSAGKLGRCNFARAASSQARPTSRSARRGLASPAKRGRKRSCR